MQCHELKYMDSSRTAFSREICKDSADRQGYCVRLLLLSAFIPLKRIYFTEDIGKIEV